jgi:hypothetical protein
MAGYATAKTPPVATTTNKLNLTISIPIMNTSENIDKISPAIVAAHKGMAPVIAATENAFLKTKYADLNAVLNAVLPSFHAEGIAIVQGGEMATDGGLLVSTRLLHESGQWIESSCPVPLTKKDGHALGSGVSYARSAILVLAHSLGLLQRTTTATRRSNIKAEDRRDKDALMAITDTQLKEANRLLKILDATEDNIAATVRLFTKDRTESVEGMMKPEAEAIIKALRKRVAKDKSAV